MPDVEQILMEELAAKPGDLRLPTDPWSDAHAKTVVLRDYDQAATWRQSNHDWRWQEAWRTYNAVAQVRHWEGTRMPRSSIGIYTAFQQVESVLPRIVQALFGDDPWVEAEGGIGVTAEAARTVRDIVLAQLDQSNAREQVRMSAKSMLVCGNGLLELSWLHQERRRLSFVPSFVPKKKTVTDPLTGAKMAAPTGEFDRRIQEITVMDIENRPVLSYTPLARFYIDPNAPSTNVQEARFVVHRDLMDIDKLKSLKETPGFDIPESMALIELAAEKPSDHGDWTMANQGHARNESTTPWIDQSVDPAARRVEVLRYWTRDRLVWLINRTWIAFNKPNPFGFIPYYNLPCWDLLDRFYAIGLVEIVHGEQNFQQDVLNLRVDELALSINPPRYKKRGQPLPQYQMRVRPGMIAEIDSPREDVVTVFPSNVTQQASFEIQASEARAQKATGVTDLALMGTPTGINPAARTATGASTQAQASFNRIQYLVENMEANVIEPILDDIVSLDKLYLDPNQMVKSLQGSELDPIEIFQADVKFRMRAGSRMQSKQGLMAVYPMILQAMTNPALLEQLSLQGKTVNFDELFQMLVDVSGYKRKADLIRDLTKEEIERRQQQQPSPEQMKMDMQRERFEQLKEMNIDKGEMELAKAVIGKAAAGMVKPNGQASPIQ